MVAELTPRLPRSDTVSLPTGSPLRTYSSTTARSTACFRGPSSPRSVPAISPTVVTRSSTHSPRVLAHCCPTAVSRRAPHAAEGRGHGISSVGQGEDDVVRQEQAALGEDKTA